MKEKWKKLLQAITNPRLLLCFGIGWIITNGWSYILLGIGTWLDIPWMKAVAGAYLTFLWLPISPEKLLTVAIAMALLRFLFPEDQKTLALLKNMLRNLKSKHAEKKEKKKNEKAETKEKDLPVPAQSQPKDSQDS